jgi:FAD/FMN-containing dehydrogenase
MSTALDALRREFGGEIIAPGDAAYDEASRVALASGAPDLVLRPRSVAEVQAAVRYAGRAGLPVAVRGGGHSFAGFGTADSGVVVDLRELSAVELVDADRQVVRIGGGATWGPVADMLAAHGLAISSGDTKTVGVGGLTLSGGIGWKVRKHGLALDSLVAVEVVTADGEVVRASAEEHSDLFWALRGGGGNLGIVTEFEFVAHPTTDVFFGVVSFPAREVSEVLLGLAAYLRTGPDEITANAVLANPFAGGPEAPVEIHLAYDGDDPDLASAALAPIRALGTVVSDTVRRVPFVDVLEDGMVPPPGIEFLARSGFVNDGATPDVLRILSQVASAERSPIITLRSVGGAVSRVAADATAYAHRDAAWMFVTTVIGPRPVVDAARPALDGIWASLTPYVTGAYANFLSTYTTEDVAGVYPPTTLDRLRKVKRRYDPDNRFARNHNVLPAT